MELSLTSIRRRFFSISLDLHSSSDTRVSFTAGKIGHVNESVVESSLDVANTENVLSLFSGGGLGRTVVSHLLFLHDSGSLGFLGLYT